MTEQKVPEGQSGEPGAAPENQETSKSITYEAHRKLLDEKRRFKPSLTNYSPRTKSARTPKQGSAATTKLCSRLVTRNWPKSACRGRSLLIA